MKLLLMAAAFFSARFAEHIEINRRFFGRGIGKNNLERQRGFAAAR